MDAKTKERWKLLLDELFQLINYMGGEKEILAMFAEKFRTEHRTLQQGFWRMIKSVMGEYAKKKYFDGRNEASVMWCKKVSEDTKDTYLPFI